ncbi:hypothetical protein BDP27DRAFT_1408363, partial [Rhodocollybia butyracea]
MARVDPFISAFDANGNPVDFPYPKSIDGLPATPEEVVKMQESGELNIFCRHQLRVNAWVLLLSLRQSTESPLWPLYNFDSRLVKIDDLYAPLLSEHLADPQSGPYPSPPASRKRPSVNTPTESSPTKRRKRSLTLANSPPPPTPSTPSKLQTDIHDGAYFTKPPCELNGPLLPDASDDDIVSFFTDLKDATIGLKGVVIYDESKTSAGIFTKLTAVDIAILIQQLRDRLFPGTKAELFRLIQDIPGAGIGPNNEMIMGPTSFLATG